MALAHQKRYQDGATEDSCLHVLAERVKDLLRQRRADGEDANENGDVPAGSSHNVKVEESTGGRDKGGEKSPDSMLM